MKRIILCAVIAVLACLVASLPLYGQFDEAKRFVEEITEPQPLAVGALFYTKATPQYGYEARYTHLGIENNVMKVKYELYYHYDELEESELLMLPASNKQAVLATKPFSLETPATTRKLLITVVDDFGRIKVQKYK